MRDKTKPTSHDIAHLAGVSQPTVSRALRNSPLVSAETRAKVQAIAKKLNYKVDVSARNLRSKHTNTLAVLLCEDPGSGEAAINPFFLAMLGSITRAAARVGYDVLISFQQLSEDWNADYEDSNKADGIIFLGYGDYSSYINKISALVKSNAHFITWGPVIKGQPGHFIGCDNKKGGFDATEHLINVGRKAIAFIGDASEDYPEFHERHMGYQLALEKANLVSHATLQANADSSEESGYEAATRLLRSNEAFDAIFCASDLIALGAIKRLKEHGLRVPEDVSVVGFDDIPTARYMSPALTTIDQNVVSAGSILVDNLMQLIAGEKISSELLPATLVVRESSIPEGTSD